MKTQSKIIGSAVVVAGIAIALLPVLLRGKAVAAQAAPPRPVMVIEVKEQDLDFELRALGTVVPLNTVAVQAQVDGQISHVYFREGSDVKVGERLFLIDTRPYDAAYAQAIANLEQGVAQLTAAEADLKRVANEELRAYVSQRDIDAQQANVDRLKATVDANRAQVQQAKLKLEFCTIRAPIAGRVGKRLVDAGNVVRAADGAKLTQITQIHPISVELNVPQERIGEIRAQSNHQPLRVTIQAADSADVLATGRVVLIGDAIDAKTGTLMLKAEFDNESETLWPGQFVDARLQLAKLERALTVPQLAVQTGPAGSAVFVVKTDSTLERRTVQTGVRAKDSVVIEQGLQSGETIVNGGLDALAPGIRVSPAPATPAT